MMLRPSANAASWERIETLLRATSEMLGAHIEIRACVAPTGSKSVPGSESPGHCDACLRSDPSLHERCAAQRDDGSGGISRGCREPVHWVCPRGCEITIVPLMAPEYAEARLVAIRPRSTASAPPPVDRPGILRFLTELSRLLSDHLSMTGKLSSVSGELSHRHNELELLYSISERLSGQEDMRKAIRLIVDQARGAVGAKSAFLSIPEKRVLEVAVADGERGSLLADGSWERVVRLVQERCRRSSRRSFLGSQWDLDPNDPLFRGPAQILSVALHTNGEVRGVLGLVHVDPVIKPRPGDLKLLESIAERVSLAVASSDLYENLKDFLMATVKSLVSALEAKDAYTCGHSERVNLLSMLIGKTMGLEGEDLECLRWASILHDVGKIGMPESILKKPGRLTAEEFEIMKEHPDRGYKVLSPIRQLATASLAVRFHHEMIDGLGYPLGLRNRDIPILSRVIAVADTYDALTSTRSYRPSRSPDQAFSVIHSVRGSQLDAGVVDVLATLMPFIREHEVMLKVGIPDSAIDVEEEVEAGEARAA